MYKSIVVGSDGSDRAMVAVKEAIALAKLTGAKLHAVHVMRPLLMTGTELVDATAIALANETRQDESGRIQRQLLAAAEEQGVPAEVERLEGDPADGLIRVADSVHADLVVVGNRGMAGVKRFVLGSVPNKVAHRCPCNILIVDTDRPG